MVYLFLAIAFALRVWGISFGLPGLFHADEPIVVNHALAYGSGDLNPHFFNIPPLVSYLLFFCYGLYFLLGSLVGSFDGVQAFEYLFYEDPSSFYFLARFIFGALLGTVSIFVFYKFIEKYFGIKRALWGAALFAVCFLHVRDSHYVYADIPLILILISAFYVFFRLEPTRFVKHSLFAGAMLGLAVAVKYNGGALGLPYLFLTFFCLPAKKWVISWSVAAISSILIFILLNPFALLDFGYFTQEIREQSAASGFVGWGHHAKTLIEAMGYLSFSAALLGLVLSFRSFAPRKASMALFLVFYYFVISISGQPYDRYVLPMLPFLLFFITEFLEVLGNLLGKWSRFAIGGLLFVMLGFNAFKSVQFNLVMSRPDVRTQAKAWIEENIPIGSKIALDWEFLMPRLHFTQNQLLEKQQQVQNEAAEFSAGKLRRLEFLRSQSLSPNYRLYFLKTDLKGKGFLFSMPRMPYDYERLKATGIEYVAIARLREDRAPKAFFKAVREKGEKVAEFTPYKDSSILWPLDPQPLTGGPFLTRDLIERQRNGQPIEIYKLN